MKSPFFLDDCNASGSLIGFEGPFFIGNTPVFDERYPLDARIIRTLADVTPEMSDLKKHLLAGKLFPDHFFDISEGSAANTVPEVMQLEDAEAAFENWFLSSRGVNTKQDLSPSDARSFVDQKDIWMLRAYSVNGVCPNGSYLYDPVYSLIPPISEPDLFLKHIVQGFSKNGNDHMALRRNMGNVPNGITGFLKDGATSRSHSSIMHDLRIVDAVAQRTFPVEIVSRYATMNLFEGLYCKEALPDGSTPSASIYSEDSGPKYALTLYQRDCKDVFERELGATEVGKKYAYDFSCYTAEIVATALACDNFIKTSGRHELLPEGYSCFNELLAHAAAAGVGNLVTDIRAFCAERGLDSTPFMLPYAWFLEISTPPTTSTQ